MGQYNFDQILDRTHTKSLKYDFAVKRGKSCGCVAILGSGYGF